LDLSARGGRPGRCPALLPDAAREQAR